MSRLLRFLAPLVLAPALFAEAPKSTTTLSFIRTEQGKDGKNGLQTLSAEYVPEKGVGPHVWLIGVAHLGTPEYYAAVQKRLDAQSAVLFEGVGGEKMSHGAKVEQAGIQSKLATALGLVFQLDVIDYKRKHFVNSDLTPEALNSAIEKRAEAPEPKKSEPAKPEKPAKPGEPETKAAPEKVTKETFDQLMQALHGEGEMAESLGAMVSLMGSTPQMRETTKVMLVEALGQAGELIDLAKSASPEMKDLFEVIITERNEEVLRQLQVQLRKLQPDQTVAIFYGAAHMDEIARRLTTELHFTPAAQQWDTAFTADTTQSIMPPAQIKMMMQMMRTQLQNPSADDGKGPDFPLFNLLPPPKKK
jgi:hypothetical protein